MNRTNHGRGHVPLLLAIVLMAVAGGCASAGGGESSGSRDVITAEDLATLRTMTAHEAVRRLKPIWLRTRVEVVVNGSRQGGPEVLRSYQTSDIGEMRYLDEPRATMKYGTIVRGAVIEISLGR